MLNGSSKARVVIARSFHRSSAAHFQVGVVGAAGGIGQPLSLLLGNNQRVTKLNLYDLAPITPGVAADLSHVPTPAQVEGFVGGAEELDKAMAGCDLVICPAGMPRKPGMSRQDLFAINAGIVQGIAESIAKNCPKAMLCIISNPVNATVPIIAETLKKAGVYDPKRLFGVTTLDICRANTFVAENQGMDVNEVNVTVVGGHAGTTIVPLLSQVAGGNFSDEDKAALTQRIMFGGDEVVQAKAGGGSATLSMAYAGARFAGRVLDAMAGEAGVTECAYVENDQFEPAFFAVPVTLGPDGVSEVHNIGAIDDFEKTKIEEMVGDLSDQIAEGVDFATK